MKQTNARAAQKTHGEHRRSRQSSPFAQLLTPLHLATDRLRDSPYFRATQLHHENSKRRAYDQVVSKKWEILQENWKMALGPGALVRQAYSIEPQITNKDESCRAAFRATTAWKRLDSDGLRSLGAVAAEMCIDACPMLPTRPPSNQLSGEFSMLANKPLSRGNDCARLRDWHPLPRNAYSKRAVPAST